MKRHTYYILSSLPCVTMPQPNTLPIAITSSLNRWCYSKVSQITETNKKKKKIIYFSRSFKRNWCLRCLGRTYYQKPHISAKTCTHYSYIKWILMFQKMAYIVVRSRKYLGLGKIIHIWKNRIFIKESLIIFWYSSRKALTCSKRFWR